MKKLKEIGLKILGLISAGLALLFIFLKIKGNAVEAADEKDTELALKEAEIDGKIDSIDLDEDVPDLEGDAVSSYWEDLE